MKKSSWPFIKWKLQQWDCKIKMISLSSYFNQSINHQNDALDNIVNINNKWFGYEHLPDNLPTKKSN